MKLILSVVNLNEIKKLFEKLDKDEDNKISKTEVVQLFELPPYEIHLMGSES